MKNIKFLYSKYTFFLGLTLLVFVSCEREPSDDIKFATFSNNGDVFIDGFVGGLDYFPFGGSYAEAFSVETKETYIGAASMRFDIPSFGASYGGATFQSTGPRDLTGFDALTFWAKASQGADINEIGFGIDGDTKDKYRVGIQNLPISTKWTKYIIPIPDASKLFAERGMFWYAEGAENATDEGGYTFWIDELKFEKLGNIGQSRPAIMNGEDVVVTSFEGVKIELSGLTQTFNLGSGSDQTVNAAPSYYTFSSSNLDVAQVSENGIVSVVGTGSATITALLGGVKAQGSLTIQSTGNFQAAPIPTRAPSSVISIFSDAYTNVPVDYYNGYFAPYQTTLGQDDIVVNGDHIISYTQLNFVGIGTFLNVAPVNATEMTHIHVDINVQEAIDPGDYINIQLINSVGNNEISGTVPINGSQLVSNGWASFDLPLSSFAGLTSRNQLGLIFFISDATISKILVDNIYYYKE